MTSPTNSLYVFLAMLVLTAYLYHQKQVSLSYVTLLLAVLFYFTQHNKEGFSIQYKTIAMDAGKKSNTLKNYVPYNLSPYLEAPYRNGHVTGLDATASMQHPVQPVSGKYPTPVQSNMFANNEARPEYCEQGNAMYSTDMGCVKLTPAQINQFQTRGYNADPAHSYI